jgi:hypothetical protein
MSNIVYYAHRQHYVVSSYRTWRWDVCELMQAQVNAIGLLADEKLGKLKNENCKVYT